MAYSSTPRSSQSYLCCNINSHILWMLHVLFNYLSELWMLHESMLMMVFLLLNKILHVMTARNKTTPKYITTNLHLIFVFKMLHHSNASIASFVFNNTMAFKVSRSILNI